MEADTHAARELELFVDNEQSLYRIKMAVFRALARKKDKARYDPRLAPKAFLPLLTTAAKKYVQDFGARGDRWNLIFCPISRRHAAVELVRQFESWYEIDYQALKTGGKA
jgi:hypothetical protein